MTDGVIGAICYSCGKCAGFSRSIESFASDKEPQWIGLDQFGHDMFEEPPDEHFEVTVCNHCGELNSHRQPWFPRLAKRHEVKLCKICGSFFVP